MLVYELADQPVSESGRSLSTPCWIRCDTFGGVPIMARASPFLSDGECDNLKYRVFR